MFKNEKKILACFFQAVFFSRKKFFPKKTSLFFSGCNPNPDTWCITLATPASKWSRRSIEKEGKGGSPTHVTGCLSFCFLGDVGWASTLPFFFYASPAPLACRGSRGYAPCVRVLPLRWGLLGLMVWSPCCPSLTLGWVCFWPAVSQAFVVRHGLGFMDAYSGRWRVQVPDVFLYLTLGSSISLPVLAAGLRWLRFILGCPPSVASMEK